MRQDVWEYYRRMGERERLTARPTGRWERLRTWDILTRFLPPRPLDIVDVGGATGAYAGPLAEQGHRVCLVDPVAQQVADAARLPGVTAVVGDATALPLRGSGHDVVLMFGPLYHLTSRADRLTAWREAHRVLRPGGLVLAVTISRFASTLDGAARGHLDDPEFTAGLDQTVSTGVHRPSTDGARYFTTAYFHRPTEAAAEAVEAGLQTVRTVAVEGPFSLVGRLGEIVDDAERAAVLLDRQRRLEEEPSLAGASPHLMTVAGRPG